MASLIAKFCVPATEPVATRAARSAYSTMSWPDSSCEKSAKHGIANWSALGFRIGSFKGFSLGDSASCIWTKVVLKR